MIIFVVLTRGISAFPWLESKMSCTKRTPFRKLTTTIRIRKRTISRSWARPLFEAWVLGRVDICGTQWICCALNSRRTASPLRRSQEPTTGCLPMNTLYCIIDASSVKPLFRTLAPSWNRPRHSTLRQESVHGTLRFVKCWKHKKM